MTFSIEDIALAYELRQEGCNWKRISTGMGGDEHALRSAVSHCVQFGIKKWKNGYARQPGRPASLHFDLIMAAHNMKINSKLTWRSIGEHLDVDSEPLRKAHYYANKAGLLDA